MTTSTPVTPTERLTAIGVTLLESYTKAKDHHPCRCNVCLHEWSATPHAIVQSNKKNGTNGCPKCALQIKYGDQRKAVLEAFAAKPHLIILSEYDGKQAYDGTKVKFRNTNCGHEFETNPAFLLSSKSKYDCTVCGIEAKSNK